jgi:hypothetical protein
MFFVRTQKDATEEIPDALGRKMKHKFPEKYEQELKALLKRDREIFNGNDFLK